MQKEVREYRHSQVVLRTLSIINWQSLRGGWGILQKFLVIYPTMQCTMSLFAHKPCSVPHTGTNARRSFRRGCECSSSATSTGATQSRVVEPLGAHCSLLRERLPRSLSSDMPDASGRSGGYKPYFKPQYPELITLQLGICKSHQ